MTGEPQNETTNGAPTSKVRTSTEFKDLYTALAKIQGEIGHADKNSENPHFNSSYADLSACIDAIRNSCSSNGISYSQVPYLSASGNSWILCTRLVHSTGQWQESDTPIFGAASSHGFGSGLTYARRQGLCAALGLAQADDDGNGALGDDDKNKKQQKNPANQRETKAKNPLGNKPNDAQQKAPVNNEAPASEQDVKKLFGLALEKKIENDDMKTMMKGLYGIEATKDLKVFQCNDLLGLIKTKTLDEIGLLMIERSAARQQQVEIK